MQKRIVRPTDDMIQFIADTMRDEDVEEVRLASGQSPIECLRSGVETSDRIAVVELDGVPCCVVGLVRHGLLTSVGVPWLLSSKALLSRKREFLIQSGPIIAEMLRYCDELVNYVHVDNHLSIDWLKRVGFRFDEPKPYGVHGAMFHRFYMRADDV